MRPADDRPAVPAAPLTGAVTESHYVTGAGGVVFDQQGRVLVLRHRDGDWVFPKGHVEGSETLLEAALREVNEEAGIVALCPEPQRTWITAYRNAQGVPRRITWFACTAQNSLPHVTEELFQEARFLPQDTALERLTFDADRQLLRQLLTAGYPLAGGHTP